jgi:hypothetical protein
LEFDGTNDYLIVGSSTALYKFMHDDTGGYMLAAVQFGTASNPDVQYALLSNNGSTTAQTGFSVAYDDRSSVPRSNAIRTMATKSVGGTSVYLTVTDDVITPNAVHVLEYGVGSGASTTEVDGVNVATGTKLNTETTAAATNSLHLGALPGGTGYAVMRLYGVIMFDATPSAGDILTARKYLAQRCGVEL